MPAVLQIEVPGASGATLQREALALSDLLSRQRDVLVERPEDGPIGAGQKGALLSLGALVINAVAPEAAKALIECLKLYFTRSRDAVITITGATGEKIEIKAPNLDPDKTVEIVARLRSLMAATG